MFNGKVWLNEKGICGLLLKIDQQNFVFFDILLKDLLQLVSLSIVIEIFREILNSVLVKSKFFQLKIKLFLNFQFVFMVNLRVEKNEKVERLFFFVINLYIMNQFIYCFKQSKIVFINLVFLDGFRIGQNVFRKGNFVQNIEKICFFVDVVIVIF